MRLRQGDMAQTTVFADDPAAQAAAFAEAGFAWLHIVDLDGAFAGKPANREAVEAILDAVSLPLQLGGGIRDLATVEAWLGRGVRRVILGTAAVRDPAFVVAAAQGLPRRRSRSASTRATARSRSKAGPRPPSSRLPSSRGASRIAGSPPSSTPISRVTAC